MATKEYTIKIIPDDNGTTKSIHISTGLLKYGIASLGISAVLLMGALGYASYSSFSLESSNGQVGELQQVNRIQQEQLLQLSKKANNLQNQLDEIGQTEMELRHITGIEGGSPATSTNSTAEGAYDGQGGVPVEPDFKNVGEALGITEKNISTRKASLEQLKEALKERGNVLSYSVGVSTPIPSIWPAGGDISSPYGLRWGGTDFHPGIDIANDFGTPIVATADGTVTAAGWCGGYGNKVDIDHGNGYSTRYGHAQQIVVVPGQYVMRGQVIAYMGSTGFSTGPHVHYEISIDGQTVNPISFMR